MLHFLVRPAHRWLRPHAAGVVVWTSRPMLCLFCWSAWHLVYQHKFPFLTLCNSAAGLVPSRATKRTRPVRVRPVGPSCPPVFTLRGCLLRLIITLRLGFSAIWETTAQLWNDLILVQSYDYDLSLLTAGLFFFVWSIIQNNSAEAFILGFCILFPLRLFDCFPMSLFAASIPSSSWLWVNGSKGYLSCPGGMQGRQGAELGGKLGGLDFWHYRNCGQWSGSSRSSMVAESKTAFFTFVNIFENVAALFEYNFTEIVNRQTRLVIFQISANKVHQKKKP